MEAALEPGCNKVISSAGSLAILEHIETIEDKQERIEALRTFVESDSFLSSSQFVKLLSILPPGVDWGGTHVSQEINAKLIRHDPETRGENWQPMDRCIMLLALGKVRRGGQIDDLEGWMQSRQTIVSFLEQSCGWQDLEAGSKIELIRLFEAEHADATARVLGLGRTATSTPIRIDTLMSSAALQALEKAQPDARHAVLALVPDAEIKILLRHLREKQPTLIELHQTLEEMTLVPQWLRRACALRHPELSAELLQEGFRNWPKLSDKALYYLLEHLGFDEKHCWGGPQWSKRIMSRVNQLGLGSYREPWMPNNLDSLLLTAHSVERITDPDRWQRLMAELKPALARNYGWGDYGFQLQKNILKVFENEIRVAPLRELARKLDQSSPFLTRAQAQEIEELEADDRHIVYTLIRETTAQSLAGMTTLKREIESRYLKVDGLRIEAPPHLHTMLSVLVTTMLDDKEELQQQLAQYQAYLLIRPKELMETDAPETHASRELEHYDKLGTQTNNFASSIDPSHTPHDNTVVHELAHLVHRVLSSSLKDKITERYKAAMAQGKVVTEYGKENEFEFFAESTQVFFSCEQSGRGPKWLKKKDKDLYNLLLEIWGPPVDLGELGRL